MVSLIVDDHEVFSGAQLPADPALGDNLVGDAFVGEAEMAAGFFKGRVDDRVFDDDLLHR